MTVNRNTPPELSKEEGDIVQPIGPESKRNLKSSPSDAPTSGKKSIGRYPNNLLFAYENVCT